MGLGPSRSRPSATSSVEKQPGQQRERFPRPFLSSDVTILCTFGPSWSVRLLAALHNVGRFSWAHRQPTTPINLPQHMQTVAQVLDTKMPTTLRQHLQNSVGAPTPMWLRLPSSLPQSSAPFFCDVTKLWENKESAE